MLRKPVTDAIAHRTPFLKGRTLFFAGKETSEVRAPGTGGCKGLILLRPFSEEFRRFPRKATCGWFWWHLLTPKGATLRKGFYGLRGLCGGSESFTRSRSLSFAQTSITNGPVLLGQVRCFLCRSGRTMPCNGIATNRSRGCHSPVSAV